MIDSIPGARYAPPLALMAVIFALSAQPDLGTRLGTWDLVLRKLAHVAEYALLFLLWAWATRGRVTTAAVVAVGYAVTDELHQSTVAGRNGTPVDVLIDAAGVGLAVLVLLLHRHQRRRRRRHAHDHRDERIAAPA